jgi:hypothetical protein
MTVDEGFGVDIDAFGDVKEPEPVSAEDKAEYENFETQAEQAVAEEASLPEDPGYEEPAAEEPTPAEEPAGEEPAEAEENEFDGFDEGIENPAEPEDGSGSEDVLGEAKEEQQESDFDEEEEEEGCVPNTANGYSCA